MHHIYQNFGPLGKFQEDTIYITFFLLRISGMQHTTGHFVVGIILMAYMGTFLFSLNEQSGNFSLHFLAIFLLIAH